MAASNSLGLNNNNNNNKDITNDEALQLFKKKKV